MELRNNLQSLHLFSSKHCTDKRSCGACSRCSCTASPTSGRRGNLAMLQLVYLLVVGTEQGSIIPIEPLFNVFPYSLSPDSLKGSCLRATSADHMKQLNALAGGAKHKYHLRVSAGLLRVKLPNRSSTLQALKTSTYRPSDWESTGPGKPRHLSYRA